MERNEDSNWTSLKEKIEIATNMQRKVLITFPVGVLRRFDEYCKSSSGDCYWLGIEQLLNNREDNINKDARTQMLIDRDNTNFSILDNRIKELEKNVLSLSEKINSKKEEKKVLKTFGQGGKEDGE